MTLQPLRFQDFELDPGRFELRRDRHRIRLERKPLELLILLAEKQGQLVGREEIIERVWGKDFFFDAERGVNNTIRKIRAALGDDSERPRFVETVVGKGYRFVATVTVVESPTEGPNALTPAERGRRRWIGAVAIAALLAVLVVVWPSDWRRRLFGGSERPIRSIAVLPLENLSGNPAEDYFADGMTEALITDLAKVRALRVISRTSVMRYKATRKPLPEIARELDVDAVVEGGVLRSGDHVRITAQLIHAPTDRHLWAESYEGSLRDVLVLQDEVAWDIANKIQVKLTPQEHAHSANARPVNPEAYDAYLRGRYHWSKRTVSELEKGVRYFQEAVEKDPSYAPAYAGLADSYNFLGLFGIDAGPPTEFFPKAKAAATRAIELDNTLAQAYSSLALAELYYDWDWASSERNFTRALQLDPRYPQAHQWYSQFLTMVKAQHDEAVARAKTAHDLDPLSLPVNSNLAWQLYLARQFDQAVEQCRKTLDLDPNFVYGHWILGVASEQMGLHEQAVTELGKAVAVSDRNPTIVGALGHAYATSGERSKARKILQQLIDSSRQRYVPAYAIAELCVGLGDKDRAFAWLKKAYEERNPEIIQLKIAPKLDPLRSDPRFQDLLRRVGLPP